MNTKFLGIGAVVLIALFIFSGINTIPRLDEKVKASWSEVENQYQRRADLIPNLVKTVKGYATHESSAFENVTKARSAAMGAGGNLADKGIAENALTGALKSVFAIAEAYPDLKANQNFLALQNELTDTEDKIQAARRFYNANVRDLNTKIESFPANLIAKSFGFAEMDLFQTTDEAEKQPVAVKF